MELETTNQTILDWLSLPECEAALDPFGAVFACGLAVDGKTARLVPVETAGHAARGCHRRHHQFGHRSPTLLFGFVIWADRDEFLAHCNDCDPFPELGLEYDREQMEVM